MADLIESKALTFWMRAALRRLADHPRMTVGWKNTPYIVASGTADALVRSGMAEWAYTFDEIARGGSRRISITDAGRAWVEQSGSRGES